MAEMPGDFVPSERISNRAADGNGARHKANSRRATSKKKNEIPKVAPHAAASGLFAVRCEPHVRPTSLIASSAISTFVSQRIRRNNVEQSWDSLLIYCEEEPDGTLAVRVLVSNPDWNELLQIACLRSRPHDTESLTALGCDLNHVSVELTG